MKPNGGPAFSRADGVSSYAQDGITARQYFACHAPPIPEWWPEAKYQLLSCKDPGWTGQKREQWLGHGDYFDDKDINPEWLIEFKEYKKNLDEIASRNNELRIQAQLDRFVAWQLAYADEMIRQTDIKV